MERSFSLIYDIIQKSSVNLKNQKTEVFWTDLYIVEGKR